MGIKSIFEETMADSTERRETDIQGKRPRGGAQAEAGTNRPTPRHHIIKMAKVREVSKGRLCYKGNPSKTIS